MDDGWMLWKGLSGTIVGIVRREEGESLGLTRGREFCEVWLLLKLPLHLPLPALAPILSAYVLHSPCLYPEQFIACQRVLGFAFFGLKRSTIRIGTTAPCFNLERARSRRPRWRRKIRIAVLSTTRIGKRCSPHFVRAYCDIAFPWSGVSTSTGSSRRQRQQKRRRCSVANQTRYST